MNTVEIVAVIQHACNASHRAAATEQVGHVKSQPIGVDGRVGVLVRTSVVQGDAVH